MYHHYNPQVKCRFLAAPREIRDAVYAQTVPKGVHIAVREKVLRLVPCVQRDGDDDPDCAKQNSKDTPILPDDLAYIFQRRLQSKWGPHWRCEENAFLQDASQEDGADKISMSPLQVCRQMSVEFVEAIFDTAIIHVSDIDSLSAFLLDSSPERIPELGRLLIPGLPDVTFSRIKKLDITLRLPIAAYKEFEMSNDDASSSSFLAPSFPSRFSQFPLAMERMGRLQRLRIWLDHDEPCSWSMVNERAVLDPLALLNNMGFEVSINLPKLHPKWETSNRHFTDDSAPFLLPIHRRYRQRYHGILMSDGSIQCKHKPDFPELYFVVTDPEWREFLGSTHLVAEEQERTAWKAGVDPVARFERDFEDLAQPFINI